MRSYATKYAVVIAETDLGHTDYFLIAAQFDESLFKGLGFSSKPETERAHKRVIERSLNRFEIDEFKDLKKSGAFRQAHKNDTARIFEPVALGPFYDHIKHSLIKAEKQQS